MPVPIVRALSKLGVLSRRDAGTAIREGRVRVNGRIVTDQAHPVSLERSTIDVADAPRTESRVESPSEFAWRTILFHKPRGAVTTTRDPEGRRTVFDVLGEAGRGLKAVGRLDLASTGLLLLTTDTRLADWLTDPLTAVPRTYVVTVRGRIDEASLAPALEGVADRGESLRASKVTVLKASGRESHLIVELREGKNREIRRLFAALGHEVTRLKRISFGSLELGDVPLGAWRELTQRDIAVAFPQAPAPMLRHGMIA